jgi:hypothetical protein
MTIIRQTIWTIVFTLVVLAALAGNVKTIQVTTDEQLIAMFEADRYMVPRNAHEVEIKDRLEWAWKAEALVEALN